MKHLNRNDKLAFSLLETIVVLFIVSIGLVSILSLTVDSVRAQNLNKNSLVAYRLAQEGLELIKNARDSNFIQNSSSTPVVWNLGIEGVPGSDKYKVDYVSSTPEVIAGMAEARLRLDAADFYLHNDAYPNSIFSRMITITPGGAASSTVVSLVEWLDQGQTYQVELKSILYDWAY
ncbi:hypothetical protein COX68_03360 [Candidatus Falkowbacteria bacterium CG_4_10_14_0_2_um_filter_41_15]|uniref:Type II secretion system protein n=4 Tax=Candidatus Falkowiibacteriota TaxID=1752728 RepID=A0A2G9ZMY5_9BACT|nr:MAG: hypothetical protein AUJ35_01885 [Candidatus Falkowbacteria bacterium CG1_02_41_21]PIP34537.1 MAG: hypothetical protein COX21_02340 [Candidatus Falkowbacteria bacterium CG23_combo_of_CG06-09_8_20_14_all_41_10]PIZ10934.1 MAG: hypothetical protein COY54_00980 [Candidatus Falkowbacteria bacterium CG_4_10_14_0_8_um_filter_41_36]PJA09100.1 MAG: hypothetical protein COX68_03360 [Candidatus Falkowbacteria bacterium CG_4_10_14_0_2_um_filter_41_15]